MPTLDELRARFRPPAFECPKYRVSANGLDAIIESGAWCGVSVKYIASADGGRAYLEKILEVHASALDLCAIIEFYLKPMENPMLAADHSRSAKDHKISAIESCDFSDETYHCIHCDRPRMLRIEDMETRRVEELRETQCPAKADQREGRPTRYWKDGKPIGAAPRVGERIIGDYKIEIESAYDLPTKFGFPASGLKK